MLLAVTLPAQAASDGYAIYGGGSQVITATPFGQIIHAPDMRWCITADGADPAPPNTPAELRHRYAAQVAMWKKFVKTSGIRID